MKNNIFNFKHKEDVVIESNDIELKITNLVGFYKLFLKSPKQVDKVERVAVYEFEEGVTFEDILKSVPTLTSFITVKNQAGIELEICVLCEKRLKVCFYLKDYSYDRTKVYSSKEKQEMIIHPGSKNYEVFSGLYALIKADILKKEELSKREHKSNRIKY